MARLVNHYIAVEPLSQEEKTESGIYIPSTRKLPYMYGKIKMVAPEVESVREGETIYFFERGIACRDVKIAGASCHLVREDALIYVE